VAPSQVEILPDYTHNKKIFSDGCGVMTSQTAKEIIDAIAQANGEQYNFIPSVVQVTYLLYYFSYSSSVGEVRKVS
jgi:hypothetical protein